MPGAQRPSHENFMRKEIRLSLVQSYFGVKLCLNSWITVKSHSLKDVFWIVWVSTWPGCGKHNIYTIAPKQPYNQGQLFYCKGVLEIKEKKNTLTFKQSIMSEDWKLQCYIILQTAFKKCFSYLFFLFYLNISAKSHKMD